MWIRRHFHEMIAMWDASARLSLAIALVVLVGMSSLLLLGGEQLQTAALVGIVTSLLFIQGLVLWSNRRMITPLSEARIRFLHGDFDRVIELLSERAQNDVATADELTLLGNAYRQLGDLEASESLLFKAVNISPDTYFPVYGLGRTLLMKGDYVGARDYISRAVELGAPSATVVDLAEVHYRLGEHAQMLERLREAPQDLDVPRQVMSMFLYRNDDISETDLAEAITYWDGMAHRFAHTPYGVELLRDVSEMRNLAKGAT